MSEQQSSSSSSTIPLQGIPAPTLDELFDAPTATVPKRIPGGGRGCGRPQGSTAKYLSDEEIADSPLRDVVDGFYNAPKPPVDILHEKPEHRLLLFLKAEGKSNVEIAEITGYHKITLGILFRQPWAQARLLEMLNTAGRDRISTLLASSAEDSVMTLIELRDDTDSPGSVRRAAADSLLDRFLGKPRQQVEVTTHQSKGTEDIAELDKQIQQLEQEEKLLIGRN